MRRVLALMAALVLAMPLSAADFRVNASGRYIETTQGEPFFWLGDTAWEMAHRLTLEEIELYLDNRAEKGFTIILLNAISHWAFQAPNINGDMPFHDQDPLRPVDSYWDFFDKVVEKIAAKGFAIGLLPTWGDKFNQREGAGPEIFTPENAAPYGRFIAERYRHLPVIWILGGDRIPQNETHYAIIDAMAAGIRQAVGPDQLITYHPWGNQGSDNYFHDRDWLDFNMIQSGHYAPDPLNYSLIERALSREPAKPVLEGEPCYEDHPINFDPSNGWFSDYEPRRAAYWALLTGACGHTYGHHSLWQFLTDAREPVTSARVSWQHVLDFPGAQQMAVLRKFFDDIPWWRMQPRQDLLKKFMPHPPATPRFSLDMDSHHAVAYSPYGLTLSLALAEVVGTRYQPAWVDPRTGNRIEMEPFTADEEVKEFNPPFEPSRGNDWLLHLRPL